MLDPRIPPEHSHFPGLLGSWPLQLSDPPSSPRVAPALPLITCNVTPDANQQEGRGLPGRLRPACPGIGRTRGRWVSFWGDAPSPGQRNPAPGCLPEPIPAPGPVLASSPARERRGGATVAAPLCLQSPGWSREAPGLGSKGSRCTGRTLAERRAQAGDVEGPCIRGLGLPPDLFT